MLAGLARDGGLYVPDAWPRLEPGAIAAFAGRPYAEVAVEIIRPFTDNAIAPGDLARLAPTGTSLQAERYAFARDVGQPGARFGGVAIVAHRPDAV